jgi:hypothetical protein
MVMASIGWHKWTIKLNPTCAILRCGIKTHSNRRLMTENELIFWVPFIILVVTGCILINND